MLAALAAAVLVPSAASARSASRVDLALVPLPKSALGAAGRSLPLARDSGVVSNAEAASDASGNVTAKQLQRLGRSSGYQLDYGNPFGSAAGVFEIQTAIERFRSAAAARKGLAFWRRDELNTSSLAKLGLRFSVKKLGLAIPGAHWAYSATAEVKGLEPIHGVDAELQDGQYLLDISISAGTTSAAARLVPTVARKLHQRLQLALAGRLRAQPVKLPRPLQPGPPPHGPKPTALVLRKADLGNATVAHQGYVKPKEAFDPEALSAYELTMSPAGQYNLLSQEIIVGASKLEVQYFGAIALGGVAAGFGKAAKATPVDLGSVGDNARGEILQVSVGGQKAYEAVVVLSHGAYLDFLAAVSPSVVTSANVQSLARLSAKRLDAGF